jgi:hypothetical protein
MGFISFCSRYFKFFCGVNFTFSQKRMVCKRVYFFNEPLLSRTRPLLFASVRDPKGSEEGFEYIQNLSR